MKKNDWRQVPKPNWAHMRSMRRNAPPAERRLWRALRANQLGAHFRRQHIIGPFIVDFCAPREQLIVEVDGRTHAGDEPVAYDHDRDAYLADAGYRVKRYTNEDVLSNLAGIVTDIQQSLRNPQASPEE